jgi:hypothetical protein
MANQPSGPSESRTDQTHSEMVRLPFADFQRLVKPKIMKLSGKA